MSQIITSSSSSSGGLAPPPSSPPEEISLPYDLILRFYQRPMWDYMLQAKEHLRACCIWPRRNGKDLISLNILTAKAVQKKGLYLYLAPYQTQMRLIVWLGMTKEGRKFLDHIPSPLILKKRDSTMEIELINGSILKFIGTDNYDSKMGAGCQGAVFTEYSLQDPAAWNYIRPMLTETGGFALFNFTMRGLNHGYKMHKMAEANPRWFHQFLTCEDTGYPSKAAIQREREDGMPESLIQQEYYNDHTASNESTFIPLDLVAPCVKPESDLSTTPELYNFEPIIFGCDVAYAAKGDKATIVCRQGRKVHFIRWYQGKNNMAFATEIARFIKIWKPVAVFIDAGRGEGVISKLEELHYDHLVRGIHFGGTVYQEEFPNMKAFMWSQMEDWFLSPNRPDMTGLDDSPYANEEVEEQLCAEISLPMKIIDERNRTSVETKRALKTRGEKSPDLAEGLALTFAEEVEPSEVGSTVVPGAINGIPGMVEEVSSYDPLSYMETLEKSPEW